MLKDQELKDPKSCLNRARDDEFVFTLLERDIALPSTILQWCRKRISLGKNKWEDAQIQED